MNFTQSYLAGTIEYLEKNLSLYKKELKSSAKKTPSKSVKLYGSLPKLGLSFTAFKKLRQSISSKWEQEWS